MVNCSQGLVLATTAMVVSTTVIVLAYSRQKYYQEKESSPPDQPRRSCLCSSDDGKKSVKRQKKRVRFAEDVKEPMRRISISNDVIRGDGQELQSQMKRWLIGCSSSYRDELGFEQWVMPANRVAM